MHKLNVEMEDLFMNNKTLIVYFSEFGTTENFAKIIQERIKGDIFKIEPVK